MDYAMIVQQARIADAQEQLPDEYINWAWLERLPFFQAWLKLLENQDNA